MTSAEQERAAVMALIRSARDCADNLEAEVKDRWGFDARLSRQLERDMQPVYAVREAIGRLLFIAYHGGGE